MELTRELTRLALLFDWVGSLLMVGTVWGWIYRRIAPSITARARASERRLRALERLVRTRYGADLERLPQLNAMKAHEERLGFKPFMSWRTRRALRREELRIQARLVKFGLATPEDQEAWVQVQTAERDLVKLGLNLVAARLRVAIQDAIASTLLFLAESIFAGRVAAVLFIVGFILWNVSKVITYLLL